MMECCVPPGFRFHPTDEELVGYYLRKKVGSQKIDLDVIREIDLYRIEPWDLIERCRIGYEDQNEWYFFSHKDKKYPTGTRTNRATMAGFWKATGRDKAVYDKAILIGMRKTLVFYKGRAPNGQKTDWIMHEYRLESDHNSPPQEEGWVVCRAFKKRATTSNQSKGMEAWDSSYFYDEPISQTLLCKQEIEGEHSLNFMMQQHQQQSELPQLESPSLPPLKRPRSSDQQFSSKKADWRDLDKFVASQLMSQEDHSFVENKIDCSTDMAVLLLETEDEGFLNPPILSSASDCGIGICLFEK